MVLILQWWPFVYEFCDSMSFGMLIFLYGLLDYRPVGSVGGVVVLLELILEVVKVCWVSCCVMEGCL